MAGYDNGHNLHSGHRQRKKRRFLKCGLDYFAPHEVVELLLYYTIPLRDTNHIGHELVRTFKSIKGILDADYNELCRVKYISGKSAAFFKLLKELLRFYGDSSFNAKIIPRKSQSNNRRAELANRFSENGLDDFAPGEALELLLFFSVQSKDTSELAAELLSKFSSIENIFCAPFDELMETKGITENSATLLRLVPQILKIYLLHGNDTLSSKERVAEYFKTLFKGEGEEAVVCFLDDSYKVKARETYSTDAFSGKAIDDVFLTRRAVAGGETKLAFARNVKSDSDYREMGIERFSEQLGSFGIDLVWFVLVKDGDVTIGGNGIAEE